MIEKEIQDCLVLLFSTKTVIIISHRLSTIKNADCIYLLRNHKIKDFGTHILLPKNEHYSDLVEAQFIEL